MQLHLQEALLQQARALQQSEAFSEYRQRRVVVEHRLARLVQLGIRQSNYPDRFTDVQLRTLQRRVQRWRGIMAKKLVYAAAGEPRPEFHEIPELALVGADPQC